MSIESDEDHEITEAVAEKQRRLVMRHLRDDGLDPRVEGPALILAGLELLATPFRRSASAAERKLVRSHYRDATDSSIDAHRLEPDGVVLLGAVLVTAARKYLDHQPETASAADRMQSPEKLANMRRIISQGISNSFAGGDDLGASSYDISAAMLVNTVAQALDRGVAPEQLMSILYEVLQRVLDHMVESRR